MCIPVSADSDTDVPLKHTHLFYANFQGLSIHNLRNNVKTGNSPVVSREEAEKQRMYG